MQLRQPSGILGRRQAVRHRILVPAYGGSNPPAPATIFDGMYNRDGPKSIKEKFITKLRKNQNTKKKLKISCFSKFRGFVVTNAFAEKAPIS
jgi:hypothetical protein